MLIAFLMKTVSVSWRFSVDGALNASKGACF